MTLSDAAEAHEEVTRFLALLPEIRSPREGWEGRFTDPREEPLPQHIWRSYREYEEAIKQTVIGLQPLMEQLGRILDPAGNPLAFREDPILGWDPAEHATLRLLGILANAPEWERILGPRGPVLAAGGLHPWVWNAAAPLWDGGLFKQAVHAAWSVLEQQTQRRLGRPDLSGKQLYAHAFSMNTTEAASCLRWPISNPNPMMGREIPEWTSAHEGAMHFGMGCAQGIRNLQTHGTDELDEQEALEYLASLSVLARWVDTTDVVPVPTD